MATASFDHVVSLGPDCLPAMQAQQYFPRDLFSGGLFNFQITPLPSLREYFARDFHGMLERADLRCVNGAVQNMKFGTVHPHQFLNGIDQGYAAARERHDYLCAKMRRLLNVPRPVLLITHSHDISATGKEVDAMLRAYNPHLDYQLICVPDAVRDQQLWSNLLPLWQTAFDDAQRCQTISPTAERLHATIGRQLRRLGGHLRSRRF